MKRYPTAGHYPEGDPPFKIDEERWMKMKPKTLWIIMGITGACVTLWGSVKWDLSATKEAQNAIVLRQDRMERQLYEQNTVLVKMDAKLDYLTDNRRGLRPPPGSP